MTTKQPETARELRRSAEKETRLDDLKNLKEQFPEQSPQIIHELLVHQVELQMQNEELRLAHQELEAEKARYFDLYELAPVGYLALNVGGLIQNSNLAASTMLGVGRGILHQNVLAKFIHPEDEDSYYRRYKQLIITGGLQKWDMRLMRYDGSIFWANVQCTATDHGDYRITFSDITDRMQAEEALHQASIYNRCLIETALDPLLIIDPDGRITDTNQAAMTITGVSREELVGSRFSCYFSDPDAANAWYRKVFLDGALRDYPLEIADRDGQFIPVLFNATVLLDSDNNVAGVIAAARDISAQILYEEALRESEDAYRIVADFTHDWEFWKTPDGSMRYTSPSCLLHTGYRAEEFNKDPELMARITHPDDRELFDCHLSFHRGGSQDARQHESDFRIITRSGDVRWFAHVSQPVYSRKGEYLGQRASNRDITDRKQAVAELERVCNEQESVVRARTSELLLANVELKGAIAEIEELKERLRSENIYLQREIAQQFNFGEFIGQSHSIRHVFNLVEHVAPMNATVLLLGETGTGKGVLARAIHSRSSCKERPMITVNCSTLPASLIESELFGREKGAFTGADARQMGRFELADGGTIFLDEIGEITMDLQSKLLRVIQDGEFERLGSPHTVKVNVRIIAASNRNLEEEIQRGRFRKDLYYRLNVFPITIPPLRERAEDIPLLINHFVAKFSKKIGKKIETVQQETLNSLQKYNWPGNVRELENFIERAVIVSQGSVLQVLDRLDTFLKEEESPEGDVKALSLLEQDHILQVLQKTGWRIEGPKGAALLLGINSNTLRSRMKKHGIIRK